jgi:hypothetical protein
VPLRALRGLPAGAETSRRQLSALTKRLPSWIMKTSTEAKPIIPLDKTTSQRTATKPMAACSDSRINPDDSAKFREEILKRYEAPFHFDAGLHG